MKGKILQRAELYLQKEGENKARHVKRWSDYVRICDELGTGTAYDERTFLDDHEFPSLGKPITEWPENNPNYKIGPERMMFCVPPDCDFKRLKELGVTVIQHYSIYWEPEYGKQYLDKAAKHGLKVLYYLGALTQDLIRQGKAWRKEECERIVKLFHSHEALWGWQCWDEPDGGSDNPAFIIPMQVQWDVCKCVRANSDKPFVNTLRGGTRGWHLCNLNLWDIIMPDVYVYDGSGKMWGVEPLVALENSARQCSAYLKDYPDKPVMFTFQCSDDIAISAGNYDTKVPLGEIENQFNVINKYKLFTGGVGMWAWNGGDFCPNRDVSIYNEIYDLFYKIKEE